MNLHKELTHLFVYPTKQRESYKRYKLESNTLKSNKEQLLAIRTEVVKRLTLVIQANTTNKVKENCLYDRSVKIKISLSLF